MGNRQSAETDAYESISIVVDLCGGEFYLTTQEDLQHLINDEIITVIDPQQQAYKVELQCGKSMVIAKANLNQIIAICGACKFESCLSSQLKWEYKRSPNNVLIFSVASYVYSAPSEDSNGFCFNERASVCSFVTPLPGGQGSIKDASDDDEGLGHEAEPVDNLNEESSDVKVRGRRQSLASEGVPGDVSSEGEALEKHEQENRVEKLEAKRPLGRVTRKTGAKAEGVSEKKKARKQTRVDGSERAGTSCDDRISPDSEIPWQQKENVSRSADYPSVGRPRDVKLTALMKPAAENESATDEAAMYIKKDALQLLPVIDRYIDDVESGTSEIAADEESCEFSESFSKDDRVPDQWKLYCIEDNEENKVQSNAAIVINKSPPKSALRSKRLSPQRPAKTTNKSSDVTPPNSKRATRPKAK